MSNFMNIELFGEDNDFPCNPTRNNMVIKTKYNGFKRVDASTFSDWEFGIIFPDKDKVQYFLDNFKPNTHMDYRDGMIPDDYVFHIIHFKYPKQQRLYADQLKMSKDWQPESRY